MSRNRKQYTHIVYMDLNDSAEEASDENNIFEIPFINYESY